MTVELLKREDRPLGSYARHYYDLFRLAGQPEMPSMLASEEDSAIKADYDEISRAHFTRSYFTPEGMRFANSDALFTPPDFAKVIRREYEAQCRQLCFGAYPPWQEVQDLFLDLRALL